MEITVHEDPVTGVWTFQLHGHQIEVEPKHGFVKIDGCLHQLQAVQGLSNVEDLAGAPLEAITRLIEPAPSNGATPAVPGEPRQRTAEPTTRPEARVPREPQRPRTAKPTTKRAGTKPNKPQQEQAKPAASLNTDAAAKYLGLSPKTLETQRSRGGGPPFVKLGTRVVYRRADLDRWLQDRLRRSTSDQGKP